MRRAIREARPFWRAPERLIPRPELWLGAAMVLAMLLVEVWQTSRMAQICLTFDQARSELKQANARLLYARAAADRPDVQRHLQTTARAHDGLTLLTYPLLIDAGTMMTGATALAQTAQPPFVELHRDDAVSLAIAQGDQVRITSARGTVMVEARLGDTVARGTAFMPARNGDVNASVLLDSSEAFPAVRVEKA